MTRFLVDMGIAQSTARFLRARGHDVVHLIDQGLESLSDELIVSTAHEESRTIVTHDLDFGRIVALSGRSVPSVVTFRLSDMTPHRVNKALDDVLTHAEQALEDGALVSVTDRGVRVRSLPVETL